MDITIVKNIGPALSNRICLIFEIIIVVVFVFVDVNIKQISESTKRE